jgi:hypothetical protein
MENVKKTFSMVHNIKSILAVTVNPESLQVHVIMQDENEEIIHLTLSNNPGQSLSHRLQQKLLELDTEIYIYTQNRKEENDSPSDSHASETH